MGKSKKPKMAPIPDLNALAEKQHAQQKQNVLESLTANRANQTNPFGSINWTRDPATGAWTQTETYNPDQQSLLDQQVGTQKMLGGRANELLGGLDIGYKNAPAIPTVGGYNQQVIDQLRGLQAPELEQRAAADRARRAAMGLSGGERATELAERNINDAMSRADMQAILGGIEQGNKQFTQGLQARQAYEQGIKDQYGMGAGMFNAAAPEDLQFGGYAQQGVVNAPDYVGNALTMQQLQQQQLNAKAAAKSKGGMMSGIGSAVGGLAGGYFSGWKPDMMQAGSQIGRGIGGAFG